MNKEEFKAILETNEFLLNELTNEELTVMDKVIIDNPSLFLIGIFFNDTTCIIKMKTSVDVAELQEVQFNNKETCLQQACDYLQDFFNLSLI
jgi:hypothetical protein